MGRGKNIVQIFAERAQFAGASHVENTIVDDWPPFAARKTMRRCGLTA
jgi:hypothetical protein